MSTINDLVQQVRQDFLKHNRDLLALTKNGPEDIMRRLTSALALDAQAQDDVTMFAPLVDQKGFAGQIAREDFRRELGKAVCVSFLKIQKNLVVEFVARLTKEAQVQLEDIEICAGVRAPRPIVPPPPPPPTAAEQLTEEVKRDWIHLRTQEVRRKLNNKKYKAEFDRLMDAGELKSQVTSYTDGGAEFRS